MSRMIVFLVLGAIACRAEPRTPIVELSAVEMVPAPAAPGSGEPNLHVLPDSGVVLSWLEPQGDATVALRVSVLRGEEWSRGGIAVHSDSLFVNWADFPSVIALDDGSLLAHWLQRNGTGRYAYDVRIARSTDGGESWGPSRVLHEHRGPVEHGFATLWPIGGDSAGAIWLDGRKGDGPEHGEGPGEMMLLHRVVHGAGSSPEGEVDARVCDCCQTSVAMTSRGPVAVYRDRSPEEIRDIAVVRLTSAGWSPPARVHADGWRIEACPVNGPAIAARGDRVAVAWFTAAGDSARVRVAFSDDAGTTFGAPVDVSDGAPAGRVAVALDPRGGAFVSWIERVGGERAEVRVRNIAPDGSRGEATTVAASSAARASGFPRMVQAGGWLVFAWTEPGQPAAVRVARARIGGEE